MDILHGLNPEQLATHELPFQDPRLAPMLFKYRARNYPYTLDVQEQSKWQSYCQNKLQYGGKGLLSLEEFMLKIENLVHEHEQDAQKLSILKALYQYVQR